MSRRDKECGFAAGESGDKSHSKSCHALIYDRTGLDSTTTALDKAWKIAGGVPMPACVGDA